MNTKYSFAHVNALFSQPHGNNVKMRNNHQQETNAWGYAIARGVTASQDVLQTTCASSFWHGRQTIILR